MIVTVSGYRGSGKSLFGSVAKEMGYEVFEMSEPVLDLMRELGMEITNETVRNFATDFREKGGPDAVAKLLVPQLRSLMNSRKTIIILGPRSIHELEVFRTLGQTVSIAIISLEENRFERIKKRKKESDPQKIEDFRWADAVEEKWGLKKLMESCELKLENNSGEKVFREKAKDLLEKYK